MHTHKVQSRKRYWARLPGDVRVPYATAPLASKLPSCDGTEDAVYPASFWRSLLCAPQMCGLSTLTCKRFTTCPSLCVPQSLSPKPSLIKGKFAHLAVCLLSLQTPQALPSASTPVSPYQSLSEYPFCLLPLDEAWLSLEDTESPSRPSNQ